MKINILRYILVLVPEVSQRRPPKIQLASGLYVIGKYTVIAMWNLEHVMGDVSYKTAKIVSNVSVLNKRLNISTRDK